MSERPTRVLIAGGGVAALELMLALRALAEQRVEIVTNPHVLGLARAPGETGEVPAA